MKLKLKLCSLIPFFGLLVFVSACNGAALTEVPARSESQNKISSLGEIIQELDEGIQVIFQDSQGNYWFGGGERGVVKYDNKTLVLYSKEDGLCSQAIVGIQEDKSGNIFFDTTDGVCKFDGQQFTSLEVAADTPYHSEWALDPDDLWFRMGWDKSGPYRYDGELLYALKFPKSSREDAFYAKYPNSSYNPYGIYSLYKDNKGVLWFGTASLGVCRYDGATTSWYYEKQWTETPAGGDFGIRSIIEDRDGHFWFCNTRYRYDVTVDEKEPNDARAISLSKEEGIGYTKEDGEVDYPYFMSIVEDDDGDLWMASYDEGVWRYDGKELLHYPIKKDGENVLVFSIYRDKGGELWLGTHNDGAYRYNGSDFEKFK